jgi:hypothetical protein
MKTTLLHLLPLLPFFFPSLFLLLSCVFPGRTNTTYPLFTDALNALRVGTPSVYCSAALVDFAAFSVS